MLSLPNPAGKNENPGIGGADRPDVVATTCRKEDVRLTGKEISNSYGARPVR